MLTQLFRKRGLGQNRRPQSFRPSIDGVSSGSDALENRFSAGIARATPFTASLGLGCLSQAGTVNGNDWALGIIANIQTDTYIDPAFLSAITTAYSTGQYFLGNGGYVESTSFVHAEGHILDGTTGNFTVSIEHMGSHLAQESIQNNSEQWVFAGPGFVGSASAQGTGFIPGTQVPIPVFYTSPPSIKEVIFTASFVSANPNFGVGANLALTSSFFNVNVNVDGLLITDPAGNPLVTDPEFGNSGWGAMDPWENSSMAFTMQVTAGNFFVGQDSALVTGYIPATFGPHLYDANFAHFEWTFSVRDLAG